jgi:succinate dehydrogenase/fumarate reductase flavoprotein subunit
VASEPNVVVVGAGNAAFCAAHAAAEQGARVVMLEKAPPQEAGGNSYFTAGASAPRTVGWTTCARCWRTSRTKRRR